MKRWLVTGCAGFIGSHLSEALLARGDDVIGVDSFSDYYARSQKEANISRLREFTRFECIEGDLSEIPLDEQVSGVDGVFHLAAQPGVRGSWGETFAIYTRDNINATQRVFESAARNSARVVFASSSSVYGDAESYPTTEETPPNPKSPYGVTKLCCEHLAATYEMQFGLEAVALRYFTVYGPYQRPDMAYARLLDALLAERRFVVFGTGAQTRDVTYVMDAVSATLAVMHIDAPRPVYNVGGGTETSLVHAIRVAEELADARLDVQFSDVAAGDVRRTSADTTLLRRDTGWSPATSLQSGMQAQFESAKASLFIAA